MVRHAYRTTILVAEQEGDRRGIEEAIFEAACLPGGMADTICVLFSLN